MTGHRTYIDSKLSLRSPWVLVRKKGPSLSFIMRTRNPFLESPERFEPTVKREGDIIL
jgi:hypothetical protein